MPMTARKHHYVPQCYLKGFARHRDKPKLFVVDRSRTEPFSTAPANVAAERDFHTVNIDGLPPDAFESSFSSFESEASQALGRIIAARSISNETDRAYLLNLACLIAIKNPRNRGIFGDVQKEIIKKMMALAMATPERWASQMRQARADGAVADDLEDNYEQMREFLASERYRIEFPPATFLGIELNAFDGVLPYFFERKWILLRAPAKSTGFVTSDYPVCLMWSDPSDRNGLYPPGYGMERTQVIVPISNELAMIGAFEVESAEFDASEDLIAKVNGSIVIHAQRQVYARDSDFLYMAGPNKKVRSGSHLIREDWFRTSAAKEGNSRNHGKRDRLGRSR